jgi:hypothetical protein
MIATPAHMVFAQGASLPAPLIARTYRQAPPLGQLKRCTDMESLRLALLALCARFGAVARLDVLPASQGGHPQALCFWRMQSPEAESRIMQAWGVGRFGGDLVMVVDLPQAGLAAGVRSSAKKI